MKGSSYRLDWSRPITPNFPGERAYHATNNLHHILVVVTQQQLLAAERLAQVMREEDPDISVQHVIEEAIRRAIELRPLKGGELRLTDEDFN